MERKKDWKSDLLARSRKDPVFFIEKVLGCTLWGKQREICNALRDEERVAVPACYDSETEILTEHRGFQYFKDLNENDKVATLESGKLVFVKPNRYYEYEYDGELIGYKGKSLNLLVTPNHSCFVRKQKPWFPFEFRTADKCFGKFIYFNKGDYVFDGKNKYDWNLADYELFGFWFGDGSLCYQTPPGQVRYKISIVQSKNVDYIRDVIKRSHFDFKERKRLYNGIEFGHENKELATWFLDNFYKNGKKSVPQWIKDSNSEFLKAFVYGMAMADGSIFDKKSNRREGSYNIHFYGEKDLAEDFYEVGVRAGFIVTKGTYLNSEEIRFIRGRSFVSHGLTCYSVTFHKRSNGTTGRQYVQAIPKNWYKQNYKGKVYCVEVPSHLLFVRRGSTSYWCGNSFGVGKTYLAARLVLWFLFSFPEAKVVSTAPTLRQVKDLLWAEIRHAYQKSLYKLGGEIFQLMLKVAENQFAIGFSTDSENKDKFTGWHSPNQLVVFDQAGGLEPSIWEAAEGLMTSANCRWLAISNTAISDGELANICMPDRRTRFGKWKVIKITAEESPNVLAGRTIFPGLVAHDWVKKREEAWGRDDPLYKIFVEAEFIPDSEMVVVPYEYITKAFEADGELGTHIEVGLDVARMGTDSTVWVASSGSRALEVKRVTGNTTMQVVGETVEFKRYLEEKYEIPVLSIKVDVIGLGAGVYDRLIELDLPVVSVNNAEVNIVVDKERYSNVRAEMAWAFRYRMEHFGVGFAKMHVTDYEIKDYVRGDIQAIRYKITSQGKIQISPKDEIKKNLGRSPDYWDALVLSFECPGGGPPSIEFLTQEREEEELGISEEEWQLLLGNYIPVEHHSFRETKISY